MQLSKKNSFSRWFSPILKSRWYFWHFEKKMIFIGYFFPKLQTVKDVVREAKNACFTRPFNKQHVKWSQTLSKSSQHYLNHIYWSIWMKYRWGKSLLVICKILGHFFNTMNADDKSSLLKKDNLTQPIKTQLSNKQKAFP